MRAGVLRQIRRPALSRRPGLSEGRMGRTYPFRPSLKPDRALQVEIRLLLDGHDLAISYKRRLLTLD